MLAKLILETMCPYYLFELFDLAAAFARITNHCITIQRKNGNNDVYFLVCCEVDPEDSTSIGAFGICCFGDDPDCSKSFSFDLLPYKRGAFSHLGIDCEDTDWEIDKEDLLRIELELEETRAKLSDL